MIPKSERSSRSWVWVVVRVDVEYGRPRVRELRVKRNERISIWFIPNYGPSAVHPEKRPNIRRNLRLRRFQCKESAASKPAH